MFKKLKEEDFRLLLLAYGLGILITVAVSVGFYVKEPDTTEVPLQASLIVLSGPIFLASTFLAIHLPHIISERKMRRSESELPSQK